jgi:ubiquinone/menaquinone biosynthesis C-methylase UbiE
MSIEKAVTQHYGHGALERAILEGIAAAGKDPERLTAADLAPVDEFHIGGRQATADLAAQLGPLEGATLLDIGCGLGGASRYFAEAHRCRVAGIDLTAEYVAVATALARRVGLAERVEYREASALALPFPATSFDGAYMLHVGMNIADKPKLAAEARRVLRRGGFFAVYDVMREGEGTLAFPVPWATSPAASFVESVAAYRRHLEAAGFAVEATRSRRDFAIEFFHGMRARAAQGGPPPLGLHILMGATASQKVANMLAILEAGLIAPTEIVARAT